MCASLMIRLKSFVLLLLSCMLFFVGASECDKQDCSMNAEVSKQLSFELEFLDKILGPEK